MDRAAALDRARDERGRHGDSRRGYGTAAAVEWGRAERLWDHATKRGAQVTSPHLLLSALEMHRATGRPAYLDAARKAVEALLAQQIAAGRSDGAFGTFGARRWPIASVPWK